MTGGRRTRGDGEAGHHGAPWDLDAPRCASCADVSMRTPECIFGHGRTQWVEPHHFELRCTQSVSDTSGVTWRCSECRSRGSKPTIADGDSG